MAKIYIVEDNKNHLESLITKVELLGHEISGTSCRAIDAVSSIKNCHADIILLDINLNGDNDGLSLANEIRSFSNAQIIFVSSLSESDIVDKAMVSKPLGYLVKPVNLEDLKVTIAVALNLIKKNKEEAVLKDDSEDSSKHITVRTGYKLQKIDYTDIEFLEASNKNYIILKTSNGKTHAVRSSLKSLCNKTLPDFFIQIHRQYVININRVKLVDEREHMLQLTSDTYLPIGRVFKKALYLKLNLL